MAVSYKLLDPAMIFTEPDTDRMILLKCILKKDVGSVWPGLRWLRLGSSGKPLWKMCWTFMSHTMLGISWQCKLLLIFEAESCSTKSTASYLVSLLAFKMFTYTMDSQLYIFLTAFFYMFSQGVFVFLFIASGYCSMVPWELLSNSQLKVFLWPIRIHKIIQSKCYNMMWLMIFMIFLKCYQEGGANVHHNHSLPCFFNLITYNHLQGQRKLHNPKQLRFISVGMWHHVVPYIVTDVSQELLPSYSSSLNLKAVTFLWSNYLSTKQHHITFLKTAVSTKHMFTVTKKLVLANLTLSRITWTLV